MLTGTHDGNLITNEEFIGESVAEASGQTWISASFTNYLGETIEPTRIKLKLTTRIYGTEEVELTTEQSVTTTIAHRSGGRVNGILTIQDNELVCEITGGSTQTIDGVAVCEITEITTSERTYNEFKFQN